MKASFNSDLHHRRSVRLKGYNYSLAGVYSLTICTHNREPIFGEISKGANGDRQRMILNQFGRIVHDEWIKTTDIRKEMEIDEFVIMPNHFHGIVAIRGRGDRLVALEQLFGNI